tara:strand:- start:864 stop:1028 length:165 start_codon:yes stop_codon:yes gene_type:complete
MNTWDKKGLNELKKIHSEITKEMADKTTWFKLSAAERKARYDMTKVIEEITNNN